MQRRPVFLVLLGALASLAAQHRTPNFVVNAPTPQIAQQVGQWAEHYRREKAMEWLGREMPPWNQPCPLQVNVSMEGPSGATSFYFGQAGVLGMNMQIQGPLDRLIASVLPHEVTHTVFAHHFRRPVPRWADEGGSVLSEDDRERIRHDQLVRQILNRGEQIPLRRLFSLKDYPAEVMCLYAEGFSITDYLVQRSNRQTFLNFVGAGMQSGWDNAAMRFFGHRTIEELEEAWLKHLRDTRNNPTGGIQVAQPSTPSLQRNQDQQQRQALARRTVRLTVPPAQPLDPAPIVRGAAPSAENYGQLFRDVPQTTSPSTGGWQPVGPATQPFMGSPVQLGAPQFPSYSNLPQSYRP